MTLAITRHILTPVGSVPLDAARNTAVRRHPERARSGHDDLAALPKGRDAMIAAALLPPRSAPPQSARTHVVAAGALAKVAGFNTGAYPTTTGTSRPGVLCATGAMDVCVGVALGGEPVPGTPAASSAKARIFHVFPGNAQASTAIREQVLKMNGDGLRVKAALAGGLRGIPASERAAEDIRRTLAGLHVPLEIDDAGLHPVDGPRPEPAPLAAVVVAPDRVKFTTDVRVVDVPRRPPGL